MSLRRLKDGILKHGLKQRIGHAKDLRWSMVGKMVSEGLWSSHGVGEGAWDVA